VRDGATVAIGCRAWDCFDDGDGYGPVDATGPDAPPAWRHLPPPREYTIELYEPGWRDAAIGVPRRFAVGRLQHAVWYGVKRGHYRLRVSRAGSHPVALCGEATYSVSTPGS
jgi:hypothetical protein